MLPVGRSSRFLAGAALVGTLVTGYLQTASPSVSAAPNKPGDGVRAAATYDACGEVRTKVDGTPWTCTFADNFNGKSLDGGNWLVGETAFSGFTTGSTCFTARNVAVRWGMLRLTARDEGYPFTCRSPNGSFVTRYTGGHIGTRGRFTQTYGKFEIRARYPRTTAGVGIGYWLYPAKLTYGAWPASGEIDIAEWWSNVPNTTLPSLHYPGSNPSVDSGWGCTVATPTYFHTYGVEWSSTEMVFKIDGQECFRRSWTPAWPLVAPQPFDHPFEMVLNAGVDRTTGPNAVTAATVLPATYEVDYVKAWR
ncbi:glycoside hydrolase family 16 protein [Nocardioides bizhenqiangii]|uniref:Glycoside hydrolase family 16 protein n=1 Tax=Nocardioides bizhenqiangii TaxID=3095076 RepID=A0ABZ0ZLS1_9ACTN|nr:MULTISPECIES: glycoside hydrolase family 16 protein [unclassified Nocardioides]MDZ5620778.1 glycoside hydrolase family 16 protein [Nocardioides sp. HM23]WQQ25143.1 glycoside hydrolase family 16 protein [Nocardioides sp. HM61]